MWPIYVEFQVTAQILIAGSQKATLTAKKRLRSLWTTMRGSSWLLRRSWGLHPRRLSDSPSTTALGMGRWGGARMGCARPMKTWMTVIMSNHHKPPSDARDSAEVIFHLLNCNSIHFLWSLLKFGKAQLCHSVDSWSYGGDHLKSSVVYNV